MKKSIDAIASVAKFKQDLKELSPDNLYVGNKNVTETKKIINIYLIEKYYFMQDWLPITDIIDIVKDYVDFEKFLDNPNETQNKTLLA